MESKHSNAHSSASPWQSGALTVAGLPMLQPRGLPWESCGARPPWESWGQRDPSESTSAVSADPVALFVKGNGCSWPERRPDLLVPPHKAHTVDMQSHSGSQGQAIQEAKGRGEERPRHLLTACFSIPVSSSCAELRGQRSPWNPSVIGTALHFPHLGGLVWAAAAIVSRGANSLRRGLGGAGGSARTARGTRTESPSPLPRAGSALTGSCQLGAKGELCNLPLTASSLPGPPGAASPAARSRWSSLWVTTHAGRGAACCGAPGSAGLAMRPARRRDRGRQAGGGKEGRRPG